MGMLSRFSTTQAEPLAPEMQDAPQHVAIIMDGNGRWAKERGLPRKAGHKKGAEALKKLLGECQNIGITYLSVYAFSSENWRRPELEVSDLMMLLRYYLEHELETLITHDIRLTVIGDTNALDDDIKDMITHAETKTAHCSTFHFGVCLNYGSRQELVHATKNIAEQVSNGELALDDINESLISSQLYCPDFPEPDLLIRTGGEKRLSNFLLWQLAYTELYFTESLWPDFTANELQKACTYFSTRERRYGNI